jgi:NAD(P)-dependent dehydrogenase (short-subunit alcohol dehydrogenase family)
VPAGRVARAGSSVYNLTKFGVNAFSESLRMAVVQRNFATFAAARDMASAKITDPAAALLARCRAYCQFAVDNPGPYRFMFSHQAPPADPGRPSGGPAVLQALAASLSRLHRTRDQRDRIMAANSSASSAGG